MRGLRLSWITTGQTATLAALAALAARLERCAKPPVLAVAVPVMGFDYSHGRRPPSDPQCIPVASFKESHGVRVVVLCPERPLVHSKLRRCDWFPASARSLCPYWPVSYSRGGDAVDEGPQPAFIRHTTAVAAWPAHNAHESPPHSRPSSATTRGTPS